MRLEELNPAHVKTACELYMERAWPTGDEPQGARARLMVEWIEGTDSLEEMFERFDRPQRSGGGISPRYSLRLGNWKYPFMKLVVQEYLVDNQYFFDVDTHDDLEIGEDNPDYAGWLEIKAFNRTLKRDIEAAWVEAELPTHADLAKIIARVAERERSELGDDFESQGRLLVVDDDKHVARSLGKLFAARGYEVELAFDGRQVLDRLEKDPLPDLVVLDYAMPELNGEQVLQHVRAEPRLRDLPVLLATASTIDLTRMGNISGLLRKPYPREVLYGMVTRLLEERRASG